MSRCRVVHCHRRTYGAAWCSDHPPDGPSVRVCGLCGQGFQGSQADGFCPACEPLKRTIDKERMRWRRAKTSIGHGVFPEEVAEEMRDIMATKGYRRLQRVPAVTARRWYSEGEAANGLTFMRWDETEPTCS